MNVLPQPESWQRLIAGYLADSLNDAESEELLEICRFDETRRSELAQLVRTDRLIQACLSPVSEEERTMEIMARLFTDGPDVSAAVVHSLRAHRRNRWIPLAAALTLLLSTLGLVLWDRQSRAPDPFASQSQVTLRYANGDQVTVKSNQPVELVAERSDVTLPHDMPVTMVKPSNGNPARRHPGRQLPAAL